MRLLQSFNRVRVEQDDFLSWLLGVSRALELRERGGLVVEGDDIRPVGALWIVGKQLKTS